MKVFFVANLHAGTGGIKSHFAEIINIMSKAGMDVTVYATQCKHDATQKVIDLPVGVYDRVICAGGDGTLDEVVAGMNKRSEKLPIGYIPGGSTNDFASSIGLPKGVVRAAEVAVNGTPHKFDLGCFDSKTFVYVAAFGLFTEVSYATPQEIKNIIGHAAYVLEGIKTLANVKSYKMKITSDEMAVVGEFIYGMVSNSDSVGGFKKIGGSDVLLDDGEFEVTLVRKPADMEDLSNTIQALLNRKRTARGLVTFKASEVTFECKSDLAWTLDGEYGDTLKTVTIRNAHNELELICPNGDNEKK